MNAPWQALDWALAAVAAMTVLNYWRSRSVLYPPFIFCFMWLFDLATYRMNLIDVYPLHSDTLAIVTGGAAVFSVGGLVASLTPKLLLRAHFIPEGGEQSPLIRNILMGVVLCGLPLFFYQVYKISEQGLGATLLMRAREVEVEAAQNGEQIGSFVLDYFVIFSSLVALLFGTEKRDWKFWVVTGVSAVGCILSTGRTNLLLLVAGLCAIKLLQEHKEKFWPALKTLRWPVALFVILYVALIFTNKDTQGLSGGATGIASYFVLSYIVGPLAAFDAVVQSPGSFAVTASHVFEFPYKLAASLHLLSYTAPPKLDTFVKVPFPTNVYTVYKFYFLELGVAGTLATMLAIGFLHSLLFEKAKEGSRVAVFLYAFSVYSVLMVIFDDAYYSVGNYIRAFVFGACYFALCSYSLRVLPRWRVRLPATSRVQGT